MLIDPIGVLCPIKCTIILENFINDQEGLLRVVTKWLRICHCAVKKCEVNYLK